ncbi:hypothetical protein CC1G_10696 [Coprinopsis cinerea okayama7|uniref:Uncharacterized protein n=1 Tax=Coprinopsis cinerea (strain Okayama-7 / 130 / ATCC MYA-4618 / FGSC 9003) TaxID=240176 RepID=A8NDS5_COPC7|nr:hypothetical protein CC1G_10696 [Coprinopsis cinerea okayama7\|eukprot:XP_001832847.1 hypothetical protein CC1G_10696 [Coprinopsis cinerea okayama7\
MARTRQWRRGIIWELSRLKHLKPTTVRRKVPQMTGGGQWTKPPTAFDALPTEIATDIILDVLEEWLKYDVLVHSYTYTFVSIRHVFGHPLSSLCQNWRRLYLEILLCSPSIRKQVGVDYIGCTVEEAAVVREWHPDFKIEGALLLLGDPNQPLSTIGSHGTDQVPDISFHQLFPSDPEILSSVVAIEWSEPGTTTSPAGPPPNIEQPVLDICRGACKDTSEVAKVEESNGNAGVASTEGEEEDEDDDPQEDLEQDDHIWALRRSFLAEELVSFAFAYCSRLLGALAEFTNLKRLELPAWLLALGYTSVTHNQPTTTFPVSSDTSVAVDRHLTDLVGGYVLPDTLSSQLSALLRRLDYVNIVGYPFSILGIFLRETVPSPEFKTCFGHGVGWAIESLLRERFKHLVEGMVCPSVLKTLKGLGWRSNCQFETVGFDSVLHELLGMKMAPSESDGLVFEEIYAANVSDYGLVPSPFLSIPIIDSSATTLKRLILDLRFDEYGENTPLESNRQKQASNGRTRHHCMLLRRFDELLPNIEYIDVTVPEICTSLFGGPPCRPKKRNGTFIVTVCRSSARGQTCPRALEVSEGEADSGGEVGKVLRTMEARVVPGLVKLSEPHFREMDDWDVEFRIRTRETASGNRSSNGPSGLENSMPPRHIVVISPFTETISMIRLERAELAERAANSTRTRRWDQIVYYASRREYGEWLDDALAAYGESKMVGMRWLDYSWDTRVQERN